MTKLKKILQTVFFPHGAFFLLLVPLSTALLIYSFVYNEHSLLAYLSYALSAYTLTALCCKTPNLIRFFQKIKTENKYVNRYFSDTALRVKLSLYLSIAVNTAYAIFQLGLGFYHASIWFYALAVYYILLAVIRYFLLKDVRQFPQGVALSSEYKRYRFCGILLMAMNLALGVIVFYITWQNRGFSHHPITTIAMAAFSFTTLTLAIINSVRYRKYQSPLLSASKAISLASASVSILTLESAMLSAFGDESSERFRRIMTAATGTAVCLLILAIASYMIIRGTAALQKIQAQNEDI